MIKTMTRHLLQKSFLLIGCLITAACTASSAPVNLNMSCDAITAEIQNLKVQIANKSNSSEVNRTIDTGTTVAAQGASIAGVPYVGSVLSIGKTLFNHNKQSAAIRAKQAEERLWRLQDLAYEKGCSY